MDRRVQTSGVSLCALLFIPEQKAGKQAESVFRRFGRGERNDRVPVYCCRAGTHRLPLAIEPTHTPTHTHTLDYSEENS